MDAAKNVKRRSLPPVFWLSVGGSVVLLLATWFEWELVDKLTPFGWFFFGGIMGLIYLGIVVWSLVHLILSFKRDRLRAVLPLAVNALLLVLLFTVPFTAITLDLNFRWRLAEREEVVSMVESGELGPVSPGEMKSFDLPRKYRHLSRGGRVAVQRDKDGTASVLFYTFVGVLDNFAGFIHRADEGKPSSHDFAGDFKTMEKQKDHWYWGSSW